MNRLLQLGIPPEIVDIWKKNESEHLLPLQAKSLKEHDLFGNSNLLIQAPTSSGKTFIGEMAAIKTALRRKKVIYLVPLKALAEEKYKDFQEKYSDYGLKVIISTRDHRENDALLENGDFSIAIVVYEKLIQLLVRRPERVAELELVIADELEILSDPERGSGIELLLTRLKQSSCRMIGLSAVIGFAERLSDWMGASLLRHDRRPVELRYGVLHNGTFQFCTYNDYGEAEETLGDICSDDNSGEVLVSAVRDLSSKGESCLVFVKSKHETRYGAQRLAEEIGGEPAKMALEVLAGMEKTVCQEMLLVTLQSGVAFHSADLTPEERAVVEEGYRNQEFKILVSTSTLAVGMNLPTCNVFISPEKWCYDKRLGMPWKVPILHCEYENMGGRAGRYGSEAAFGRSILIANSAYDKETLWQRYIQGDREAIQTRLEPETLENEILLLVASLQCTCEQELFDFFSETITGKWVWEEEYTIEEVERHVSRALFRGIDSGTIMIEDEAGSLQATPLGSAVASNGVSLSTAQSMEEWVRNSQNRNWTELDVLLASALSEDGRNYLVSLYKSEYESQCYLDDLREHEPEYCAENDTPLSQFCNDSGTQYFEDIRGVKAALILQAWIEQWPMRKIERKYKTMAGQVLSLVGQHAWLLEAMASIARASGVYEQCVSRLESLALRVKHGVQEEALTLVPVVGAGISRKAISALVEQGLHTPQALVEASAGVLELWLTSDEVKQIKENAFRVIQKQAPVKQTMPRWDTAVPESTAPVLLVDETRPGEIMLDGASIRLQENQYQLIYLLAEHAGQCVGYEDIYEALWGNSIVEQNQIHFQKQKLKKAIELIVPKRDKLIKTISKRGFSLCLESHEVHVHKTSCEQRALC